MKKISKIFLSVIFTVSILAGYATFGANKIYAQDLESLSEPINGRIIYLASENGLNKIKSARFDGESQKDIVSSANDTFGNVRASADGTKIVYTVNYDGLSQTTDLYSVNMDGTNNTQLTFNKGQINYKDDAGNWSPDGTKIVFTSNRDTGLPGVTPRELYIMNSDGTSPERLTDDSYFNSYPMFKNNDEIIFSTNMGVASVRDWYVMDLSDKNTVKIAESTVSAPGGFDRVNQKLYYGAYENGEFNLFRVDADGNNKTQITNSGLTNRSFGALLDYEGYSYTNTKMTADDLVYKINLNTGEISAIDNDISKRPEFSWQAIQPLTILPHLTDGAALETDENGNYDIAANVKDSYDGLDLTNAKIISGNATIENGIINAFSAGEIEYKICSISNPKLCNTFKISSNFKDDNIEAPNTGFAE